MSSTFGANTKSVSPLLTLPENSYAASKCDLNSWASAASFSLIPSVSFVASPSELSIAPHRNALSLPFIDFNSQSGASDTKL